MLFFGDNSEHIIYTPIPIFFTQLNTCQVKFKYILFNIVQKFYLKNALVASNSIYRI